MKKFLVILALCMPALLHATDYLTIMGCDYFSVQIGDSSTGDIKLYNTGPSVITIDSIVLHGESKLNFKQVSDVTFPFIIEPGSGKIIDYEFRPTEEKEYEVKFYVHFDSYDIGFNILRGNGILTIVNELHYTTTTLSPNPARDYIEINNVMLSETKHPVVKIYDVLGIEQSTSVNFVDTSAGGGHVRIDVSGLPKGVYFVRVGGNMYKFVKM